MNPATPHSYHDHAHASRDGRAATSDATCRTDVAVPKAHACCSGPASMPTAAHAPADANHAAARDPVCGMQVDARTTTHRATHNGATWHFCSARCRERFAADPAKYLAPQPVVETAAAADAIHICPMHPQIRQQGPGTCPICGMALEPEMPGPGEDENPELRDFSHRFRWTLPLTLATFALAMFGHRLPQLPIAWRTWLELALSAPVVLWAGWPWTSSNCSADWCWSAR